MTATALIIDDEVDLCRLMQLTLKRMHIKTDIAYTLSTARELLSKNSYDFCLTDLRLPDGSGLDLVKELNEQGSTMPIAVITAHGNIDLAIQALKYGAFDFVHKPLELPRLRQLVEHTLKIAQDSRLNHQNTSVPQSGVNDPANMSQNGGHANNNTTNPVDDITNKATVRNTHSNAVAASDRTGSNLPAAKTPAEMLLDARLIGQSTAMQSLKATILKLARSQAPVFLWGESGTGKEVVAKLIHELSPRREGNFVPVNCGAIPSELMESEFFGHKKGSFTGATKDKQGLFQQADGGTLFLDEVADLPLAMQVKLLRAIQEKTVRPIGDTKEYPIDLRLLSATHKNLNKLVQEGAFRQDLFYRINVIELKLPTLNERENDIEQLAYYFLRQIQEDWELETPVTLSESAINALQAHDFKGNVRELRNILERAITLTDANIIDSENLGLESFEAIKANTETPTENQTNPSIQQTSSPLTPAIDDSTGHSINYSTSEQTANHLSSNITQTNSRAPNEQQFNSHQSNSHQSNSSSTDGDSTNSNLNTDDNLPVTHSSTVSTATANRYNEARYAATNQVIASLNNQTAFTQSLLPSSTKPQLADTEIRHNEDLENRLDSHYLDTVSENLEPLPEEGLEHYLQQQEIKVIMNALSRTGGNKTQAAKLLKTSFRSLRYRMKKLNIDTDDIDTDD